MAARQGREAARLERVAEKVAAASKRHKTAAAKQDAREATQERTQLFTERCPLLWWFVTPTATAINAPEAWLPSFRQAVVDEPHVTDHAGVVEVGKRDGLRHYHWLIRARTSADSRKFSAWCNDLLSSHSLPTKFQMKKTTSQSTANVDSILVCIAKDKKLPHFKFVSSWVTEAAMVNYHAEGLRRNRDAWLQDRNRVTPKLLMDDIMKSSGSRLVQTCAGVTCCCGTFKSERQHCLRISFCGRTEPSIPGKRLCTSSTAATPRR